MCRGFNAVSENFRLFLEAFVPNSFRSSRPNRRLTALLPSNWSVVAVLLRWILPLRSALGIPQSFKRPRRRLRRGSKGHISLLPRRVSHSTSQPLVDGIGSIRALSLTHKISLRSLLTKVARKSELKIYKILSPSGDTSFDLQLTPGFQDGWSRSAVRSSEEEAHICRAGIRVWCKCCNSTSARSSSANGPADDGPNAVYTSRWAREPRATRRAAHSARSASRSTGITIWTDEPPVSARPSASSACSAGTPSSTTHQSAVPVGSYIKPFPGAGARPTSSTYQPAAKY